MRILFLGNRYNVFGIACLTALLEMGDHSVVVAANGPLGGRGIRGSLRALRRHGARFVARRVQDLARARLRVALRRARVPLAGFASLDEVAMVHGADRLHIHDINDAQAREAIATLAPDLIIVAGFSRILRSEVIRIPKAGCINVHPSLLPRYRGPNPFYWVLANCERRTGVTIHYIDEGIDSGDIILQRCLSIGRTETEQELRDRAARLAAEMVVQAVRAIEAGEASRTPQDPALASYFSHPPRGASRL